MHRPRIVTLPKKSVCIKPFVIPCSSLKYSLAGGPLSPDAGPFSVREQLKELTKEYDKSENDLKALQSVGQIVGEVLKQLTEDKCEWGPRA